MSGTLTLRYEFGDHVVEFRSECEPQWGEIHRKAIVVADVVAMNVDPEGGYVGGAWGPRKNPDWNRLPIRQRDTGDETAGG